MDWKNQFAEVEQSELLRTTVEIPHTINSQIKKYEPKTGVLQNTISILIAKLSHELDKSNITVSDRYAYQRALSNSTLVLGGSQPDSITLSDGTVYIQRSTAQQPSNGVQHSDAGKAAGRNDNGGAKPVARKTKRAPKSPGVAKPCSGDGAGANGEEGK